MWLSGLQEVADNSTRVLLSHDGWGCSVEWQQVRKYFERAWGEIVLPD
jgi:hypothetical protein